MSASDFTAVINTSSFTDSNSSIKYWQGWSVNSTTKTYCRILEQRFNKISPALWTLLLFTGQQEDKQTKKSRSLATNEQALMQELVAGLEQSATAQMNFTQVSHIQFSPTSTLVTNCSNALQKFNFQWMMHYVTKGALRQVLIRLTTVSLYISTPCVWEDYRYDWN